MKFDYSRIPDPMEKYKQLGIEITDDFMDTIIQLRNQIEAAKKDFEKKGYFGGIFMWLESHSCFAFVVDNCKPLQDMGVFEAAFSEAFIKAKINNSNIQWSVISTLLRIANREKLMSMGDPLPENKDTYKLYRGISGKGAARRKYGHSWTGTLDTAKWFTGQMFPWKIFISIQTAGTRMSMSV